MLFIISSAIIGVSSATAVPLQDANAVSNDGGVRLVPADNIILLISQKNALKTIRLSFFLFLKAL
jgi:hypothetical protein